MATVDLESDLYEDLYADDDYSELLSPTSPTSPTVDSKQDSSSSDSQDHTSTDATTKESNNSGQTSSAGTTSPIISAPRESSMASTNAADLSYSAQIAQQFSAYQQTSSQERKPRFPLQGQGLGSGSQAAIASYESRTENLPGSLHGKPVADKGMRPSEMKEEGKMFIGGLSWDTTDDGLVEYFSQFGRIDAATILRDVEGRSRGFAFLTYEDPASVNAVMAQEHFLDGKSIDPKRAIPRSMHARAQRFFVGGLALHTTSLTMRAFFEQFGKIVDVNVMNDKETGKNKGFGFVTFEDLSDAEMSRLTSGGPCEIDGKAVEVKLAQPRSSRTSNTQGPSYSGPTAIGIYTSDAPQAQPIRAPVQANTASPRNQDMTALFQRMQRQMGMMGTAGAINPMMNPMLNQGMGMGMGMGAMNGMGMGPGIGGAGMMNMGMGMNPMLGNMGAGRMMGAGMMNPSAMGMQPGAMGMSGMNQYAGVGGMQGGWNNGMPGMAGQMAGMNGLGRGMGMGMGAINPAFRGRGGMNGVGPARVMNRGHNNFHPYARQ